MNGRRVALSYGATDVKERHRVRATITPGHHASRWRVKWASTSASTEAMKIFSSAWRAPTQDLGAAAIEGRFHVPLLLLGRCDLVRA